MLVVQETSLYQLDEEPRYVINSALLPLQFKILHVTKSVTNPITQATVTTINMLVATIQQFYGKGYCCSSCS